MEKGTGNLCHCLDIVQDFRAVPDILSGDTCITRLNDSEGIYNGLCQLLALFGFGVIYRFFALTRQ